MDAGPSSQRRVVFATAGHVDHGKTSLMRRLTGTDTDRLPDEKRRGISIELGFAELPNSPVSFIDVPGHRRLVHAMIAGVGGVDALLLVVAADDAVMPQTREHLAIASLLGIDRVLVALTKVDLVDDETQALAQADVESTLEEFGLSAWRVVATSTESGAGIAELDAAVRELAQGIPARRESARLWLPIDRVFSVKGSGTVVTGTLTRGQLRVAEPLFIAGPSGVVESACRGLHVHGRSVDQVQAPARVAVNLARLALSEVKRGDVVSSDPRLCVSRRFDLALRRLDCLDATFKPGASVVVHVGTSRENAKAWPLGESIVHVFLERPLPAQGGVGVVLRGFVDSRAQGAVLGGGLILDARAPAPPRRREAELREHRVLGLSALERADIPQALAYFLSAATPRPLDPLELESRLGLEPNTVGQMLGGKRKKSKISALSIQDGRFWTTPAALEALIGKLLERVELYHRQHPHEPGPSLETMRTALARRCGRELAEIALTRARSAGKLVELRHGVLSLPSFHEQAGPEAKARAARVLEQIASAGLVGISEASLSEASAESAAVLRVTLAQLSDTQQARRLGGLWFSEPLLEQLRGRVISYFSEHERMSVPEFKDLARVSRKQAIPLLEQLDREGTTRRVGDDRVLGARAKG